MTEATVILIARLMTVAIVEGYKLSDLVAKMREQPEMTDELWETVSTEFKSAWDAFDAAPGPDSTT